MAAFIHLQSAEPLVIVCPSCAVVPMHIQAVATQWRMAKPTFTYECTNCGKREAATLASELK